MSKFFSFAAAACAFAESASAGDMEKWLLSVTLAALVASTAAANATDSICEAVAMKATTKTDDFPYPLKRGETIDAITQYNVTE